jgi:heme exporter protein CcmD
MPDWLQNPHADYVLAAYGVALAALAGLLIASWRAARQTRKIWQKMEK